MAGKFNRKRKTPAWVCVFNPHALALHLPISCTNPVQGWSPATGLVTGGDTISMFGLTGYPQAYAYPSLHPRRSSYQGVCCHPSSFVPIGECVSWPPRFEIRGFRGVSWQAQCGLGGTGVGERIANMVRPIHFGLDPGLVLLDFLLNSPQFSLISWIPLMILIIKPSEEGMPSAPTYSTSSHGTPHAMPFFEVL